MGGDIFLLLQRGWPDSDVDLLGVPVDDGPQDLEAEVLSSECRVDVNAVEVEKCPDARSLAGVFR